MLPCLSQIMHHLTKHRKAVKLENSLSATTGLFILAGWDKVPTVELWRRLGIVSVVEVMRWGRLRWFGHVEQKKVDDWLSACRNLEVAGSRGKGRPRLTWRARLDGDMKDIELRPEMAMDREKWKCGIMGRTPDPHERGNNRL